MKGRIVLMFVLLLASCAGNRQVVGTLTPTANPYPRLVIAYTNAPTSTPVTPTQTPTATITLTPTITLSPTITDTPTPSVTPSPTRDPMALTNCQTEGGAWIEAQGVNSISYTSGCLPVDWESKRLFSLTVFFDKENKVGEDSHTLYLAEKGDYNTMTSQAFILTDLVQGNYVAWGFCDDKCGFWFEYDGFQIARWETESYGNFCREFSVPFDFTSEGNSQAEITISHTDDLGGGAGYTLNLEKGMTCDQIADEE